MTGDGLRQPGLAGLHLHFERLAPAPRVERRQMPLVAANDGVTQSIAAERLGQVIDDALPEALDRGIRRRARPWP